MNTDILFNIIQMIIAITTIIIALYQKEVKNLVNRLPNLFNQYGQWIAKPQLVGVSITPIQIIKAAHTVVIWTLIVLFAMLFVVNIMSGIFQGFSPEKIATQSFLTALAILILYRIRYLE